MPCLSYQASKKPKAGKQEREEQHKVSASDVTAMAEKLKVGYHCSLMGW